MASLGISEFTFGFAFLYEQVRNKSGNLVKAPVLPSLQQEADEGWDAYLPTLGTDFYYQFKLSDYLWTRNAKYIKRGHYDAPYFRIALHRHQNNQQHRRLREHALDYEETYYVAPQIETATDFNQAFLNGRVTEISRLIPVRECEDIADDDGRQHYITFQPANDGFIQHSNAKRRSGAFSGSHLTEVYLRSRERWRPINEDFAMGLYEKAWASVRRVRAKEEKIFEHEAEDLPEMRLLIEARPRELRRKHILQKTSDLLATYFGLTMVLVGERSPA